MRDLRAQPFFIIGNVTWAHTGFLDCRNRAVLVFAGGPRKKAVANIEPPQGRSNRLFYFVTFRQPKSQSSKEKFEG